MLTDFKTSIRFAAVLGHRAGHHLKCFDPDPIARELVRVGINEDAATALAWGTGASLGAREVAALADSFAFHQPVLALLFLPGSAEVVEATLEDILPGLNVEGCEICGELADQIERYLDDPDEDELDELLLAILEHVIVRG